MSVYQISFKLVKKVGITMFMRWRSNKREEFCRQSSLYILCSILFPFTLSTPPLACMLSYLNTQEFHREQYRQNPGNIDAFHEPIKTQILVS